MRAGVAAAALAISLLTAGVASAAQRSRLIVFGRSIGGIEIGMPRATVQSLYGHPNKTETHAKGTSRQWSQARYRVPLADAALWVSYRHRRVVEVETSSPIFHNIDGVHPGQLIHDYECVENGYIGSCDQGLLGFRWREDCRGFVHSERGIVTLVSLPPPDMVLPTRDNRQPIEDIVIGYPVFTTLMDCG